MIKPIDIEDAVRDILSGTMTAYCRPLPKTYSLPNILVTATGGSQDADWKGIDVMDTFTVKLDCRGASEASALDTLRTAIGTLQASRDARICRVLVNSLYSWGNDGTRPDLAMCSATLLVTARPENK